MSRQAPTRRSISATSAAVKCALARGLPQQEQQQVDVYCPLLLQGDAGIGHLGLTVEAQRELPERRSLRG